MAKLKSIISARCVMEAGFIIYPLPMDTISTVLREN